MADSRTNERANNGPLIHEEAPAYPGIPNRTRKRSKRICKRLTNAFSKKIENHKHALSLHYMYYNFVRKHQTLTQQAGGIHKTPAMAKSFRQGVPNMLIVLNCCSSTECSPPTHRSRS